VPAAAPGYDAAMGALFDQPAWAAAGGVLAAAAVFLAARRRRSWRWRLTAAGLPLAAAALAALALAGPAWWPARAAPVALVLDLSPSARTAPWQHPAWVRALARNRLDPGRPVTVVDAAGRVLLRDAPPGDADRWPAAWPAAPAGGPVPADAARWVLTDGLAPDLAAAAARPAAWTLLPPAAADVGVTRLELRPAADSDSVDLLVQVRAVGPHPGPELQTVLRVRRDGAVVAEVPVTFSVGAVPSTVDSTRWVRVHDRLPAPAAGGSSSGRPAPFYQYDVRLSATPADPWPENDTAEALWTPGGIGAEGGRRVLVVGEPLVGLLPDSVAVPEDRFPADASQLAAAGWQVIVRSAPLDAAPPEGRAMPPSAAAAIDRFVRDTGGGLLLLGRPPSAGPDPAADTLARLSPVWTRPHAGGRLHVVFVLDASASMNGPGDAGGASKFRLLAEAVAAAADLLAADDRVTVLTFNDTAARRAAGPWRDVGPALRGALAAVAPAGGTTPDAALPLLTAALDDPAAAGRRPLIVLVTDGDIPAIAADRWAAALAPGADARLALVAPAAAAGGGALARLRASVPGTTLLPADDPAAWAGVLRKAVIAQVEGPVSATPLPWRTAPAADFSADGDAAAWARTWVKPEATLLAEGRPRDSGEPPVPAAAIVQRGLGRAAAVPLALAGGAAPSPGGRALLDALLQRLAPPAGDRRFTAAARPAPDGGWQLSVDAADGAAFLDHESLTARVLAPGAADALAVAVGQTGPGHYAARLPGVGPRAVVITRAAGPAAAPALVARLSLPAVETAEWPASVERPLTPGRLPIGAAVLSADPADGTRWDPAARGPVPLAPAFWTGAALVALAALWARR
jgi:hypothetical protein